MANNHLRMKSFHFSISLPVLADRRFLTVRRFLWVILATLSVILFYFFFKKSSFYHAQRHSLERFNTKTLLSVFMLVHSMLLLVLWVFGPIRLEGFMTACILKAFIEFGTVLWSGRVMFLLTTDSAEGLIDVDGLICSALLASHSLALSSLITPGIDFAVPVVFIHICFHISYEVKKRAGSEYLLWYVGAYAALIILVRAVLEYRRDTKEDVSHVDSNSHIENGNYGSSSQHGRQDGENDNYGSSSQHGHQVGENSNDGSSSQHGHEVGENSNGGSSSQHGHEVGENGSSSLGHQEGKGKKPADKGTADKGRGKRIADTTTTSKSLSDVEKGMIGPTTHRRSRQTGLFIAD